MLPHVGVVMGGLRRRSSADDRVVVCGRSDATLKTEGAASDVALHRGERIGRYLVLGELGRGAMGVVYRAYDPGLNRKIALKVLRHRAHDESRRAVARVRLQREAQTLARLMHANVVAVFDVGTHGGDVFVAMELLEGDNLAQWLTRPEPSIDEILAIMLAAGEGLAAAHDVGIVHRDFKPSNVLVTHDGRVAVSDFGLARPETTEDGEGDATADPSESMGDGSLFDLELTEQGHAVGTPAYMAPEQHLGQTVDARSDQYAYCVTLYEALYGKRPFDGLGPRLLTDHKLLGLDGLPPATGPRGRVSRRIRVALARGLRPDPSRRFPTLAALLHALRAARRPAGYRTAAVVGTLAAMAGAWAGVVSGSEPTPCLGSEDALGRAYDADTRAAIDAALRATEVAHATRTADLATARLDAWAGRWTDAHREACEATWIRHEQSPQRLDARMACLDDARRELDATVDVLATADGPVADRAIGMIAALDDPARCGDPAHLAARADVTSDGRTPEVDRARDRLARAEAARRAGRHREALTMATALAQGEPIPHPATAIEVQILHGRLLDDDGDSTGAAETLEDAALAARAAGLGHAEARAWMELARIVGGRLHDAPRGQLFGELALAASDALDDGQALRASAKLELGEVAFRSGDDETAGAYLREALALRRQALGDDHYLVGEAQSRLAGVALRQGHLDDATALLEHAIETYTSTFGPTHPRLAAPMGNLGLVLAQAGRREEALDRMQQARAIARAAYGDDHPAIATADDSIGRTLQELGRLAEADRRYRAAIATFERTVGPDDPRLAAPLLGLGETLLEDDRTEEATQVLSRALALAEGASLSPVEVGDIRFGLARALGDGARAVSLARQADADFAKVLAADAPRRDAARRWLEGHATDI